jgi:hypothetical protein
LADISEQARQQTENLKQQLNSRAGEIAIVRSKQEKTAKEFERELTTIKKLNAERIAKQQKEIEAAKDAERTAATELEFMKRDLLEETEKVRSLKRSKDKGKGNELLATPKKTKVYRDGFDDDEIQIISPSKINIKKSNPSTPTKPGGKRKRKGPDSPSIPLELSHEGPTQEQQLLPSTAIIDEALLERIRRPDDRFNVRKYNWRLAPCFSLIIADSGAHLRSPTTSRSPTNFGRIFIACISKQPQRILCIDSHRKASCHEPKKIAIRISNRVLRTDHINVV